MLNATSNTAISDAQDEAVHSIIPRQAIENYQKPILILDGERLRTQARRFKKAMPRVQAHYAVKCNQHPTILSIFHNEGVRFEIASQQELEDLMALGVNPPDVLFSNPIRSPKHLQFAVEQGIEWYVIDSVEELNKTHRVKPDAKFYLRIFTSNEGSTYELSSKFGAANNDIDKIIKAAKVLNADLAGVTFHAGSQCLNVQNWVIGIRAARELFDTLMTNGFNPRLLNIAGGYPVEVSSNAPVPSIEEIGSAINQELTAFPNDVHVIAEPGRFFVSEACTFLCRVIGTATRNGQSWLYLDAGLFNGLADINDMPYQLKTDVKGDTVEWRVAGPTCDSYDTFTHSYPLPANLQADDFIYIEAIGAYSYSTSTTFNGFAIPEVTIV